MPAGPLLSFVTNGGYSRLLGCGVAVAFCSAERFVHLLRGPSNVSDVLGRGGGRGGGGGRGAGDGGRGRALSSTTASSPTTVSAATSKAPTGPVLVMVRTPCSRHFRPALASVRW